MGCGDHRLQDRVVVIPRESVDARWLSFRLGLSEGAAEVGEDPYWNGPSLEGDVQAQIDLADRAVQNDARGIIAEPNSLFALNRVFQDAISKGIPVVIVDDPLGLPPERHLSYVLGDEGESGRLIAERVHRLMGDEGQVVIAGLLAESPGSVGLADHIQAALLGVSPHVSIVDRLADSPSVGLSVHAIEDQIRGHPQLRAIIALTQLEGVSAVMAVHATGAEHRVHIIACGQSLRILYDLRNGKVDSVLVQDLRQMGHIAIRNVAADNAGKAYPALVYVKPALIDAQNIDSEFIQQLLLMHRSPR